MTPEEIAAAAAAAAAANHAPPPNPAVPPAAQASGGENIPLTPAEYRTVLAERALLKKLQSEQKAANDRTDSERLRLMAEKGQYEEAISQQKTRFEAEQAKLAADRDRIQGRYLDRERSLAVNDATAGVEFLTEFAAKQCRQLLEGRFEVLPNDDGSVQVVDRATRRPAPDVAREWLAGPEAAHFLKPKGKGGSTPNPGNTQADGGSVEAPDDANLSYEQKVMRVFRANQQRKADNGWELGVTQQAAFRKSAGG